MTLEEWNSIKPGDVLIDHRFDGARRHVFEVSRTAGKASQRGRTRTTLVVNNLRNAKHPSNLTVIIFESDRTGPPRFDRAP